MLAHRTILRGGNVADSGEVKREGVSAIAIPYAGLLMELNGQGLQRPSSLAFGAGY
ncbi:MAG: hypothetical protein A4E60_03379 [Syntrophorhabdus sp. PtaB.Bin047]|jgi:hypothetical protein|nr:MAG: hypothetical protein A4E60_03379 [Syntrophorhabdus sp. PtaB.Bin047]